MIFSSATELRVRYDVDGDKNVRLLTGSGVTSSQILIYVEGADHEAKHPKTTGDDRAPTIVDFGEHSIIQANVYAPSGTIQLKRGAQGSGSFWAKHVRIGRDVQLTLDSAFK